MRRAAGIALVLAIVVWIQRAVAPAAGSPITVALGFTLIAAMALGEVLRRFRLPRLSGYLLFGLLVGPYLGNLITEPMARQLQAVNGVAITLIALIAGLTLNFERLEQRVPGIKRLIAVVLAVSLTGLFVVTWAGWTLLPIAPDAHGLMRIVMAALFATVVISFSPTMTAAVISETGARGRVTDIVLALVVVADLCSLAIFSLLMQAARGLGDQTTNDVNLLVRMAWEIGGAVAFGALIGALLALYLRYIGREVTLVLLGVAVLLSQVGTFRGVEPLLAGMAAGLVIQNAAVPEGDALKGALQRGALPVLVVFFVSVGASLSVESLASWGAIAGAVAAVRLLIIRVAISAGLRATGMQPALGNWVWSGLISQAGMTLGLASVLASELPPWGIRIQMLLVAVIAIDELIGPALFRLGLARAGELDGIAARPLIVVSNRQPYTHRFARDGQITVAPATGGVAVALDALLREREGIWIAYGDGSADRAVVSSDNRVQVPPDQPAYTLRRLWLDPDLYGKYYAGFANEGLWPLCHQVDVRPRFRSADWEAYCRVNQEFAQVIDQELPSDDTPVFLQDYHLALVATALRARRPSCRTALFWHIPWPSPDRLRICPWRRELLTGLLDNDLLAFQLERDRRNFVAVAVQELGVGVEADGNRLRTARHVTTVVSAPIGVDYDRIQAIGHDTSLNQEWWRLRGELGLDAPRLGIGVDRLDYTKGIPERLDALDELFTARPELVGHLTFLQVGVPTRSEIDTYRAIADDVDRRVDAINRRHGRAGRPLPLVYHKAPLSLRSLTALYRRAEFCIVSSLHDGMNLVAKEFVAAREDEDGVLVLSALAGAAEELDGALIINPYDQHAFVTALSRAIDMSPVERTIRMQQMRRVVAGRNVFGWASDILEDLESLWTKPLQYAARAPEDAPV